MSGKRISKLCEFLNVPIDEVTKEKQSEEQGLLARQLQDFHYEIKSNIGFRERFGSLRPLLSGLQQSLQGKDARDE